MTQHNDVDAALVVDDLALHVVGSPSHICSLVPAATGETIFELEGVRSLEVSRAGAWTFEDQTKCVALRPDSVLDLLTLPMQAPGIKAANPGKWFGVDLNAGGKLVRQSTFKRVAIVVGRKATFRQLGLAGPPIYLNWWAPRRSLCGARLRSYPYQRCSPRKLACSARGDRRICICPHVF